jgi:hypothetical protein
MRGEKCPAFQPQEKASKEPSLEDQLADELKAALKLPRDSQERSDALTDVFAAVVDECFIKKSPLLSFLQGIGALRTHLPRLNSKTERENRIALENAMNTIPGLIYNYLHVDKRPTFEELTKLRLRRGKYDRVKIIVKFFRHPKTSENDVTDESIWKMNDDALLLNRQFCRLEEADRYINHKGILKRPVQSRDSAADVALQDADETAATENIATE